MSLVSGDVYEMEIGPFVNGGSIEYKLLAIDESILQNEVVDDNGGLFYSFTVPQPTSSENVILFIYLPIVSILALILIRRRKR